MSYINGLKTTGLNALATDVEKRIYDNSDIVTNALKNSTYLRGLGNLPEKGKKEKLVQTFEEVVSKYNVGITKEEIQAWVWYKRRLGIPMLGWKEYFLTGGTITSSLLYAERSTTIKDNHFRDLRTVPTGAVIGTATKKTHTYDKEVYVIVRTPDNELVYAPKKDIKEAKGGVTVSDKELTRLVNSSALYYSDGELLPEPIYTFGNIYSKIAQLEKDKEAIIQNYGEVIYKNHLFKLEERKPRPLSIADETPSERPHITPYSKFPNDFPISTLRPDSGVILEQTVSITDAFKIWLWSLPMERFVESKAHNIIEYYINGKNPTAGTVKSFADERVNEMRKAGSTKVFSDRELNSLQKEIREDIKSAAKNEGERMFNEFLFEAIPKPIQQDIDTQWNKLFNGDSEINYTKIPIGCELSATWNGFPWSLKPVQREGVGFMEAVQSGILAFDVGVGKTLTAIVEMAQALYDGKCKRALLCVPDGVYEKWKAELFGQYDKKGRMINTGILSNTGIVLNEYGNLGAKWLGKINVNKVPENSITMVNFHGLNNIGFGMEAAEEFIEELTNILAQEDKNKSNREQVKDNEKLFSIIGGVLEKNVVQIDKVGFDYLVIDEAHNFKNVFAQVKMRKEDNKKRFHAGGGSASSRAIKAFFLANYIQRKYGKNIMLLSATPFTNHPIEVYSMLSLVGYDSMKKRNIEKINDFFELHVREEIENVVTQREKIEPRAVIKAFNNRMLLQSLIYNHIIYRTADGEVRPEKVNLPKVNDKKDGRIVRLSAKDQILTYLKMTPLQREVQNEIISGIEDAIKTKQFGQMLAFQGMSLNNALSPFIAKKIHPKDFKEFINESPKIKYAVEAIKTVKQWHEKNGEECSGQIIYINRGKEYFKYIKEALEKEVGFKRGIDYKAYMKSKGVSDDKILDIRGKFDEVTVIEGGNDPEKKDAAKEAFNAGVIKVIIGTSTISEGMDFQKRGTVIYNLYPEYNPTQLRQLEGRIWRFGNPYEYVRIVLPLVQDSMDVFIFQKLEEKTSRINDLWYRSDRGNVLDMDALDPEEVKFALITKVDEIAKIVLSSERKEVERRIGIVAGNVPILKQYKHNIDYYETRRERVLSEMYRFIQRFEGDHHIQNPPTKEQLSKLDAKERENIKKNLELFTKLNEFKAAGNAVTDMDISVNINRLKRKFEYFDTTNYNSYKYIRDEVVKTEKLITGKGFTKDDDIEKIIAAIELEVEGLREQLTFLLSDEHYQEILADVHEKKSALQIEGKSVSERVEEFAKLNSLLAYVRTKGAKTPKSNKKQAKTQDYSLDLIEAEAMAELMMLELLTL